MHDRSGEKHGRLTLLERIGTHRYPSNATTSIYRCRCDCGKETIVLLKNLLSGTTKSCGCLMIEKAQNNPNKIVDLTGKKFNRLLALERYRKRNKLGISTIWYKCRCDCGKEHHVLGAALYHGNTKSCGCLDLEKIQERNHDPVLILKRVTNASDRFTNIHWKTGETILCKGAFEANVVDYLNENHIDYKWQIPFTLSNGCTYLCDLYLPILDCYIEIKGRWYTDAIQKYNMWLIDYPNLKTDIWDSKVLKFLGISLYRSRTVKCPQTSTAPKK